MVTALMSKPSERATKSPTPPSRATNAWYCPPSDAPRAAAPASRPSARATPKPRGAGRSNRSRQRIEPRAARSPRKRTRAGAPAGRASANAGCGAGRNPNVSFSDRKKRPPPSIRPTHRRTGRRKRPCPAPTRFPSFPAACSPPGRPALRIPLSIHPSESPRGSRRDSRARDAPCSVNSWTSW